MERACLVDCEAAEADEVRSLAFSPRNDTLDASDTLAAGLRDGTVRVWSVPDFETVDVLPGSGALYALDYMPDGTLVFGEQTGGLAFWTPQSAEERGILKCGASALVFSSNGELLAAIERSSPTISVWQLNVPRAHKKLQYSAPFNVSCIAASSGGHLAAGDSNSRSAQIFDFATGRSITRIEGDGSTGSSCIAFSPQRGGNYDLDRKVSVNVN